MLLGEVIRVALQAIAANKLRSMLTMLGIVIGVAAVITMVALGTGAQRAVQEQIEQLGTNVLSVRPGQAWFRGTRGGSSAKMEVKDALIVQRDASAITAVAPEMQRNAQVEFGRSNANLRVTGTSANYYEVNNYEVIMGRFFEGYENEGRRRVAVLGGAVPAVLGTTPEMIVGQKMSIQNVTFEVVGVLGEKGGWSWFNMDERIFVPINTAQFRLFGTERIGSFNAVVRDGSSQTLAMAQIEEVLRREHRLRVGQETSGASTACGSDRRAISGSRTARS